MRRYEMLCMCLVAATVVGSAAAQESVVPQNGLRQQPATGQQAPVAQVETPSAQNQRAAAPRAPFQLDEKQQQRIDRLLIFWEQQSKRIKTYSCRFNRLVYDPVFGPKNPNWHRVQSEGVIRFADPDRGEFRVDKSGEFLPPAQPNGQPAWPMKKPENPEHWICDGQSIFELNGAKKQLIESKLPPEMRGQRISDGPLPFMFGATQKQLSERYWIRELVPPEPAQHQHWLEAIPKRREDAAEFKFVRVILDGKTFLPDALQVFPPSFDPKKNNSRTVYTFSHRQVNHPNHKMQQFLGGFIVPRTPIGWKKVVQDYGRTAPDPVANRQAPAKPRPNRR